MIPIGIKERTEVFENVRKAVAKKIFAPSFDGANWSDLVKARRQQILAADTVEELESEIRDLLAQLKIKPHYFLPSEPAEDSSAVFYRSHVSARAS